MKKLVVSDPDSCIQCGNCEDACSKAFYKEVFKGYSCIHVTDDGIKACNQCGMCAKVCPLDCISVNKLGVSVIDKNECMGCCACVDICPQGVMVKSLDKPIASKCIACGICAKACPMGVLEIVKD